MTVDDSYGLWVGDGSDACTHCTLTSHCAAASHVMASRGDTETARLRQNVEDQLNRLLTQLQVRQD